MSPVFVIGHRNPDTDSICSAICYAHLKRRLTGGEYIACRAGHVNAETKFVLERFGVEPPRYIKSFEPRLSDVQYQIESWQSQLDWYSNQVSCCTVYITLNEVETLTPTSTSFGAKLLAALRNGWTGFVSGAQAAAVFLVGAWPAILIGAVCGVIYYRVRHPRKKK